MFRRLPTFVVSILFSALISAATVQASPDTKPLVQSAMDAARFEAEIQSIAAQSQGTIGVGIRDLTTGENFFVNPDRPFSLAGLSKIYVLAALMRESSRGNLSLDDKYTLTAKDKLPGGILFRLGDDSVTMSLRDYATLLAAVDDNSATQLILSRITLQTVQDTLKAVSGDKIRFEGLVADPQKPVDNLASPRALLDSLHTLYSGPVLGAKSREEFFSILSTPRQGAMRAAIPSHIRVASKSGIRGSLRATAGIIFLKQRPYAIVILSQPPTPGEKKQGVDASATVSALSKLTFEYFSRLDAVEVAANPETPTTSSPSSSAASAP
jgi:beta-lactamase class A